MASVPFNNLITFSRGSNATLTGPTGLVQYAPNNLLTFSEQFDNAAWSKSGATVSANTTVAPDGTSTADALIENTATTTQHFVRQSVALTAVQTTFSVYVKASGRTAVRLINASYGNGVYFGLTGDGVVGTADFATGSIVNVGNDWYRCSITFTSFGGSNGMDVRLATGTTTGSDTYTGNGTGSLLIWGAQLEIGSAATAYNSTTVKNLLGFSEAFDNAGWSKSNVSIVTGAQTNPVNGAFNAQKLMESAGGGQHFVVTSSAALTGPVTLSVYAKAAGRNWLRLQAGGAALYAWFNLSNGTLGTVNSGCAASIIPLGNGWYRCSATVTYVGVNNYVFLSDADGTFSYTGDGNSGVYIYGAQLSDSASLDPYVPTPAAAPTSTAFYGPRFDYDPVTLAPKGLLVEEARTNLLLYSEQFDNAGWTKTRITVTANANTSPDGTLNADTLTGSGGGTTNLSQIMYATGGAHTATIYAKVGTKSVIQFSANAFAWGVDARANFDLASGVLGTVDAGLTAAITSVSNGWFRCSVSATKAASAGSLLWCIVDSPTAAREASATAGTLLAWGAQLEAGAFATSYIPTVASTVTRAADIATINGSLFSQWFSNTQGSFVVQADVVGSFGNYPYMLSLSGQQGMFIQPTNILGVGRIFSNDAVTTNAASLNTAFKAAGGYSPTNPALAVLNGGTVGTGTETWSAAADQLRLGANVISSRFLNGHIRSIDYIPTRIADFQLQALTELPLVPTLDLDFLNNLYEA